MKMKDSGVEWIGEIPEDWTVQKVKHQFDRKKGKPETEDYEILKLARSGIQIRDISSGDGQIAADYSGYNPVEPLDILINPMDLISGDNSNISKVSGVISQAYINLRFRSSINPYFYNYYFKLQYWLGAFFTHGKGVSFDNRWTINDETLRNFPIIVPTLNEQNKIVELLDSKLSLINQIIADTKRSIEELKSYKQSLITETVTKGLDPNVPMKDSGVEWIGEIPVDWEVKKLKYYISIKSGESLTNSNLDDDGEFPVYGGGKQIGLSSNWNVTADQILIGRVGANAGQIQKLFQKSWATDNALIVNVKIINQEYLYYLLEAMDLNRYNESSAQPLVTASKVLNLTMVITSDLIEQKQIADFLDEKSVQVEKLIEKKQDIIAEYESYKKSLIYEYVTGKKTL